MTDAEREARKTNRERWMYKQGLLRGAEIIEGIDIFDGCARVTETPLWNRFIKTLSEAIKREAGEGVNESK